MRPLRKGIAYLYADGQPYGNARDGLLARIGQYCSYCERVLTHAYEVEHIQPKSVPGNEALECCWSNFLLSCRNCNSCKWAHNPLLSEWLIPDRDNTFVGIKYLADGMVLAIGPQSALAQKTIGLVGLDREVDPVNDEAGVLVAIDRRTQRISAWILADRWLKNWEESPTLMIKDAICDLALKTGFFSIWLEVFSAHPDIRQELINQFPGTETGCFDIATNPISPHPNTDVLPHGGKL